MRGRSCDDAHNSFEHAASAYASVAVEPSAKEGEEDAQLVVDEG